MRQKQIEVLLSVRVDKTNEARCGEEYRIIWIDTTVPEYQTARSPVLDECHPLPTWRPLIQEASDKQALEFETQSADLV